MSDEAEVLTYHHGVIVVGDGPSGLAAALLLAKNADNDLSVKVFGEDETYAHDAHFYNYPGIDTMDGSDWIEVVRDQCKQFGADLQHTMVTEVKPHDDGFKVITSDGEHHGAKYLVLTEGDSRELSKQLGLAFETTETEKTDHEYVKTDKYGRTSMENVYAGGWTARDNRIQAAISVGDGQAIALDILSKEKGRLFHDFDVPE